MKEFPKTAFVPMLVIPNDTMDLEFFKKAFAVLVSTNLNHFLLFIML